jgi:T-complex protein 1 subunit beta
VLPQVLKSGASEEKGEMARLSSFVGAIAVADSLKTTLGPKGMDKILMPAGAGPRVNDVQVTNDGATILRSMHIDNPAAKILIEISKAQDDEIGDGTTSVAVLAGEILREGERLVNMKIHPQVIIAGWRKARDCARRRLLEISRDNSADEAAFRNDLLNIAKTTLSSKLLTHDKEHFARLAV